MKVFQWWRVVLIPLWVLTLPWKLGRVLGQVEAALEDVPLERFRGL